MFDKGALDAMAALGLKTAEVLGRVYSQSKKGKRYTVRKAGDGYSCTCLDYKYRHAGKGTHCKHIQARVGSKPSTKQQDIRLDDRQPMDQQA